MVAAQQLYFYQNKYFFFEFNNRKRLEFYVPSTCGTRRAACCYKSEEIFMFLRPSKGLGFPEPS